MHCSHCRPHILCGLAVVLLSGCQWHPPYGYGYPGTYAAPGTIMPQQTFPGPPPGNFQPTPQLAPGGNTGSPTFQSPGSSHAPAWNPPAQKGGAEKPVPLYGDPAEIKEPGASRLNDEGNKTPFSQMSGELDSARTASVQHAEDAPNADSFEKPISLDPESAHRASNGAAIPYDYDHDTYSKLVGKVDYDESDKSWHIVYNPKPSRDDKFGGAIRLLPHTALDTLHDGDVVQIEGEVDYDHRDEKTGKAQYRIAELGRLKPVSRPVAN